MSVISQGQSCDVPAGEETLTVTNLSADRNGSYDITGDGIAINKQIDAGDAQHTDIHKNPCTVTNSGKPNLSIENCG